jgi:hypothetical protein
MQIILLLRALREIDRNINWLNNCGMKLRHDGAAPVTHRTAPHH